MTSRSRQFGSSEQPDLDLYSGYNEYPDIFDTTDMCLVERPRSSRQDSRGAPTTARKLGTGRISTQCNLGSAGFRGSTARPETGRFRPGTSARPRPTTVVNEDTSVGMSRPMTAIQGAGYLALNKPNLFDPLKMETNKAMDTLSIHFEPERTREKKIHEMENKIWKILDDSILAGCDGQSKKALDLAKEAQHKQNMLVKEEEACQFDNHNWDLTFSVIFNLAIQCEACELYQEALGHYETLSKQQILNFNKAKIRLNMGNLYMKLKLPNKAIKIYRMALDQIGSSNAQFRLKLLHNTGLVFLQVGNLNDAMTYFENIMQERPSFKVGFHLVIANFMANDAFSAKRNFQELLEIQLNGDDEGFDVPENDPVLQLLADELKIDSLSKYNNEKRTYAERCIITSARLIAPIIEDTISKGYDWLTETIRNSKHGGLASALEISKAVVLIKEGEISEAISVLKTVETKATKFLPTAATNLSFIYYLKGEMQEALKYGNMAIDNDMYNGAAYVNVANCIASSGDIHQAKHFYQDSLEYDNCLEAHYNLGLVNQQSKCYEEALLHFEKVTVLAPNNADAIFQMGKTLELMDRKEEAVEWYFKALGINQHDAGVLKNIAKNFDERGDKIQAYQYYTDCFKYNPSDIWVIKWLTLYLTEKKLPDQTVRYLERGLLLQPNDPIWRLSIAQCYRESGNVVKAMECYEGILRKFPNNVDALEQLVILSKRIGDTARNSSYLGMMHEIVPKAEEAEIEYDSTAIASTPRLKQFRRMEPGQNRSRAKVLTSGRKGSGDLLSLGYLSKSRPAATLDSGIRISEIPKNRFGAPTGRRDLGRRDKKDDSDEAGKIVKHVRRPESPSDDDDDEGSRLFKPQRERKLEVQAQGHLTPQDPEMPLRSVRKIQMPKSSVGLFDDVALPRF